MNRTHGLAATYSAGCRCLRCRRAHRIYRRSQDGLPPVADAGDDAIDHPWVLLDFPVAVVARDAFPDDDEVIARAFPDPNQLELELDPRPEEVTE